MTKTPPKKISRTVAPKHLNWDINPNPPKHTDFIIQIMSKFRILVFPWLGYSHVFPFLELSKSLSSSNNFHIHFCTSSINLDLIKPALCNNTSIDLVELQIPTIQELPPNLHTTKNLPSNLFPTLLKAFQMSSSSFSQILDNLNPDLLIYDFFQPWAAKMALARGVPAVYFATSGAAPFSYYYHLYLHGTSLNYPHRGIYLLDHERVDVRAQPPEPLVKDADDDFAFGVFGLSSEVVLVRSSREVEEKYIEYLSTLCGKKVVPTGALVKEMSMSERDGECEEIVEWMNNRDESSVVYICFGSEHFLSEDMVVEMARGLEDCEADFIWAVKFDGDQCLNNALPDGFLDRVKGRGLVLKDWAPQGEILRHKSVGAFVSHCGWSSMMESLYYGVPVIAMPIKYDQPINCRLMVKNGAGVEAGRGEKGEFLGMEVACAIREVFRGEKREELRRRARELGERMRAEAKEAMDGVVKELLSLCQKGRK